MPTRSRLRDLECAACGHQVPWRQLNNTCPACERFLLARYDLRPRQTAPEALSGRAPTMWRYEELLPPLDAGPVTLGEMMTPLLRLTLLERECDLGALWLKDEGRLPTGTFKARGMALAVTMAKQLGARAVAAPSAGNAGAALAAYARRAGLEATVFFPPDVPAVMVGEARAAGARVVEVESLAAGAMQAHAGANSEGWFAVNTLFEPYRVEGKKTMGLEIAEQLSWQVPDVIIYPTGGGTGLIGLWKAFNELHGLGWVDDALPRMVAVQPQGCAPLVRAFARGAEECEPWESPQTIAPGLRVPRSAGDFYLLRILRESNGTAVAVSDAEIEEAARDLAGREGMLVCPEGAATLAALRRLHATGWLPADAVVVAVNTGTGLKHPELFR